MSPSIAPTKKMTSLLRSFTDRIVGNGTANDPNATKPGPDGFLTAKGIDALFARTTPAVDGDDCLHDCATCTINYPRKWSIDEDDKLYGHINGWARHIIVATGKTDWVRDVADEKESVMEAISSHNSRVTNGKLMLSASDIPVPDDHTADGPYGPNRKTTVLLLPSFTFIDHVTPTTVPSLIDSVINPSPTNTTPLTHSPLAQPTLSDLPSNLTLRACPHNAIILLCSQATRDARCGQSAPLLRRELERHLRPLGLYRDLHDERPGGVGIYFISHVGGHKYSANMMVYRRAGAWEEVEEKKKKEEEVVNGGVNGVNGTNGVKKGEQMLQEAGQCIWLARIRPEDCENVVRYTVLKGKVVKPDSQLRGGFDRGRGIVSW